MQKKSDLEVGSKGAFLLLNKTSWVLYTSYILVVLSFSQCFDKQIWLILL